MKIQDVVRSFEKEYKSNNRVRTVGLELEYPLTKFDGTPINLEILQVFWDELISKDNWRPIIDDITNETIGVKKLRKHHKGSFNNDVITVDFGFPTIELSLTPSSNLAEAENRLSDLIFFISTELAKLGCVMLGYGVQPIANPDKKYVSPKSRHNIFFNIYEEEKRFRNGLYELYIHCLSASSQVHVKVSHKEAITALNALNASSGLRIALLANSPVWRGEKTQYKALRELFWDWCWPNRSQQVGIPPHFGSVKDYIYFLLDFRALAIAHKENFQTLDSIFPFRRYFFGMETEQKIDMVLTPADINQVVSYAWHNARLQSNYGTVEDRVSCQQPPNAQLVPAALTLGLVENIASLERLTQRISLDQWREIRILACSSGLDLDYELDILSYIEEMLTIAHKGLSERKLGEEKYLDPLFERLESRTTPADTALDICANGGIIELVARDDMSNFTPIKKN